MRLPGPSPRHVRACVVGSVNVDLFLHVDQLPARGETVLGRGTSRAIGGKGANQAVALARLGASTSLIGAVGDDGDGRAALGAVAAAGVDIDGVVVDPDRPTGLAAITLDGRGENTIVVTPGANSACTPAIVRAAAPRIDAADLLLAQLELPLEAVDEAFRAARSGQTLRVLNAAPARTIPGDLLRFVDVLVVNEVESSVLSNIANHPERAALALSQRGPNLVVVTLGERGSLAVDPSGQVIRAPAFPVTAVDTTGAGDAFVACFALLRAANASVPDALGAANVAAALSTLVPGAQAGLQTWDQVRAALGDPATAPG